MIATMPPGLDLDTISRVAEAVRAQIAPRLSPLAAVPLERLAVGAQITGLGDTFQARARLGELLAHDVWGLTTIDRDRAWIWLNREAWAEVGLAIPRTRFTLAHELGHVALHADELDELDVEADPEHDARLEAEANAFAARLLIPDQALRRLSRERPDAIAQRFGVSLAAASRRLQEWLTTSP